ncbi:MAG: helix-turn-helix domain-containing protein, partial [Polyangiaceae bacterium]|nr:helix-turn-helix domain-containing protein [Polyangiaceae bacterium]
MNGNQVLNPAKVAKYFNVTPNTIYGWIRKGIVPAPEKERKGMREKYVFTEEWLT